MIVLQSAADEQCMVAIGRNVIVEFRDIGVELSGIRRRKGVSFNVQAIPPVTGIRQGIALENGQDGRVRARTQRAGATRKTRYGSGALGIKRREIGTAQRENSI